MVRGRAWAVEGKTGDHTGEEDHPRQRIVGAGTLAMMTGGIGYETGCSVPAQRIANLRREGVCLNHCDPLKLDRDVERGKISNIKKNIKISRNKFFRPFDGSSNEGY